MRRSLFRRTEKQQPAPVTDKVGGKGRPTPTRKEAQAAARERARTVMDKKAARKLLAERRTESNQKVREGMRKGDPRYMMERDKGPVKALVRDFVDIRYSFMEYLLPMLVIIMVLQLSTVARLKSFSAGLWSATILLLLADTAWLMFRLGKEIASRLPEEDTRGWRFYAVMRAIQLRPLRQPKPRLKPRESLPRKY